MADASPALLEEASALQGRGVIGAVRKVLRSGGTCSNAQPESAASRSDPAHIGKASASAVGNWRRHPTLLGVAIIMRTSTGRNEPVVAARPVGASKLSHGCNRGCYTVRNGALRRATRGETAFPRRRAACHARVSHRAARAQPHAHAHPMRGNDLHAQPVGGASDAQGGGAPFRRAPARIVHPLLSRERFMQDAHDPTKSQQAPTQQQSPCPEPTPAPTPTPPKDEPCEPPPCPKPKPCAEWPKPECPPPKPHPCNDDDDDCDPPEVTPPVPTGDCCKLPQASDPLAQLAALQDHLK